MTMFRLNFPLYIFEYYVLKLFCFLVVHKINCFGVLLFLVFIVIYYCLQVYYVCVFMLKL